MKKTFLALLFAFASLPAFAQFGTVSSVPLTGFCQYTPVLGSYQDQNGAVYTCGTDHVWHNLGNQPFSGAPTGSCTTWQQAIDSTTGDQYNCYLGAWNKLAGGGGGGATIAHTTLVIKGDNAGNGIASSIADDGTNPTRTPNGTNTAGSGLSQEYANANPGTVLNKVFVINSSQQAVTATVAQVSGIAGVAIAGAGDSGTVTGCITQCLALYDNQTTIGHVAIVSTSVAGELHDTGSANQTSGVDNFLVDAANSGSGTTALTEILTPRNFSAQQNGLGGKTTIQVNEVTTLPIVDLNDSTPAAGSNGKNVTWQKSNSGGISSVSAEVVGDGNSAHFLNGIGTYTAATGGGDTITSPNATIGIGGTSTATTIDVLGAAGKMLAGSTPALTYTPSLGVDNSQTGTIQLANGSASAHTLFGSAATTSNTILGPAVVIPDGHAVKCSTSSTNCTLADGGNIANIATRTVCINDVPPTSGDDGLITILNPATAIHIVRFSCGVTGTTSVVTNLVKSSNSLIADTTCTAGTANQVVVTAFVNGSSQCGGTSSCAVAAHAPVTIHVGTVSGTPTSLNICTDYTVD